MNSISTLLEGCPVGGAGYHMSRSMLGLRRVVVSGPSMVPTLRPGDVLLVRHDVAVRPGDLVLARYRSLPDRLVVKRAVRAADGGWWLASDNTYAGGDSAAHGVADVQAKVVLRLRPGLPRRVH
jgi:phage repressor protein C with HTH and peptisase S24 domain